MTRDEVGGESAADPFRVLGERFRSWYGELEEAEVTAQDPILIVSPSPTGGSYTLVVHGTETTVAPVPVRFVAMRTVAHLPVAIWTLHRLSPTLSSYQLGSRLHDVEDCIREMRSVSASLLTGDPAGNGSAALATSVVEACNAFLHDPGVVEDRGAVLAFMDVVREPGAKLLADAASLQIASCTELLDDWHGELGDAWSNTMAIVGSSSLTGTGPHVAIVRSSLGRDAEAQGRLLVADGVHDAQLLRVRLGRVLANRRLAADWHGDAKHLEQRHLPDDISFALDALD